VFPREWEKELHVGAVDEVKDILSFLKEGTFVLGDVKGKRTAVD
jgi:hypothetical protein